MPWNFINRTILQGSFYVPDNTSWNDNNHKWNITSDSRHVVWFAPLPSEGKTSFGKVTILNGVTIRGGNAQGNTGITEFLTDRGGGAYMSINAYMEECVVTENTSNNSGGGIYLDGGRVLNSLVYNNNAEGNGGGVFINNAGIVLASMLTNNSAANGAYGYCPSLIIQDLETNEFVVVSSGVTLSSINKTNGVAVVAFIPEDMPFFTTVNRIGHEFEVIACLAQLDATNGTALVGEGATVYYGQEHVPYGARSLEFTEGFGRKTIILEDKPPKNYDGVSISVEAFTVQKKSGTSVMGDSWTDFYVSSDIVIDWETDDRYDNTNFPVQICFLSSNSGLPIINGGQAVGGLYKTVTVLASKKNWSGTVKVDFAELAQVVLSAPTTIGSFTLIVKAVIDNPDTEIGQEQITAQNTYTLTL